MKQVLMFLLVIAIAACSTGADDGELSAADQAKARALLVEYEQARHDENWEVAESRGQQLRQRYSDSPEAEKAKSSLADVIAAADQLREARRLRDLWDYQAVSVSGGVQRTASIYSRTVPAMEGEPLPIADAQLVLRDHPAWGQSAYLLLAQSRFSCGSPCVMDIAFDGGEAQRFAGKQADSGQGPALFIVDRDKFVARLASAKQVRIQLPKGSGLVSSLTFEVGGFQPARYAKP